MLMMRLNGGDRVVSSFDISGLRNLSPEPQREKSHVLFHIGAQLIASTGAQGSAQQIPASQPIPHHHPTCPQKYLHTSSTVLAFAHPRVDRGKSSGDSLCLSSLPSPLARFTVTHSQEPAANHPVGHLVDTTSDGGTSESLSHHPV